MTLVFINAPPELDILPNSVYMISPLIYPSPSKVHYNHNLHSLLHRGGPSNVRAHPTVRLTKIKGTNSPLGHGLINAAGACVLAYVSEEWVLLALLHTY